MKFTTREGSKAAYEGLFRIQNVMFVTTLHDTASKRKDEQAREKKKSQGFASVLEQACSDKEKNEISYTTSGYTKNGTAYHNFVRRREYVY